MNKVYEKLIKNGYCIVSYRHHPKDLKNAIKAAGFRPMAKECFANSQKLVVGQRVLDLDYVEGIVRMEGIGIPFEHAWVADKTSFYDVTLNPMPKVLCYKRYNRIEVINNMKKTMLYTGLDWNWLEIMKNAAFMGISLDEDVKEIAKKINESFDFLKRLNSK